MTSTLLIRKDRLGETRLHSALDAALAAGQVRVAPELLALTANNITYAAFGDSMDYWRFFPSAEEGWGVLPAWGFYSCAVGAAHVDQLGGGAGLPGPRPTLFFAPAQAKKRQTEWGGDELQRRLVAAWNDFLARALESDPPWLRVERHEGMPAAQAAYTQLLSGRVDPAQGQVLAPGPRA